MLFVFSSRAPLHSIAVDVGGDAYENRGGTRHVNGIKSFWSYAKHRLAQFHGIRREKFELHLKETEFRFNHRKLDLYKTLLKLLKDKPPYEKWSPA